jgi:hypothetical protein
VRDYILEEIYIAEGNVMENMFYPIESTIKERLKDAIFSHNRMMYRNNSSFSLHLAKNIRKDK